MRTWDHSSCLFRGGLASLLLVLEAGRIEASGWKRKVTARDGDADSREQTGNGAGVGVRRLAARAYLTYNSRDRETCWRPEASTHACWTATEASGKPAGEREVEPGPERSGLSWHMSMSGCLVGVRWLRTLRCFGARFSHLCLLVFADKCACFRSVSVFSLDTGLTSSRHGGGGGGGF
jgi:hypothetical protein